MARRLRFIPKPGTLVETTSRIIQGRMLLRPSSWLNEMIVGTIARAKRKYGVRVCGIVVMSNHLHLFLEVDNAKQLADFQCMVLSKIAREVARKTGWTEKVWGRRYTSIEIHESPEAQIERFHYLLSHGVKENLVARCTDWPGVHCAESLITGRPLVGYWFDRTAEYNARLRGQEYGPYTHAKLEQLAFEPLPCWKHLDPSQYRERVAAIVEDIETKAEADRKERNIEPLGAPAVLRQNPTERPERVKRSPAPLVHAASRAVRKAYREAYRAFAVAYFIAAEKLRAGCRDVVFPDGCFPPRLPFVPLAAA